MNSPSAPLTDHAKAARWYAEGVVSGEIPACKWVRLAADRHFQDLKSSEIAAYPFTFDADKGARVCRFIELLPHTKGKWASKSEKIKLQPWQCFLIVTLFGWLKRKNGKRRFRKAYFEIPRKNGKSIIAAGIGLYMLLADGEFGAEVYSGATTEVQAWEVFKPAKLMLERSEKLRMKTGAEVRAKTVLRPADGSKFEPVIGNPGDGSSPSCAIVDEYHEHQTPALHDTMETGMGAREQPLMLIITTAGFNVAGPCYDQRDELCKVLEGTAANDDLFGTIWTIDADDDWASPAAMIKANPNYGVSIEPDFLISQQRSAMQNPLAQNKFKTKHLNVWTSVLAGVMNMQDWQACEDKSLAEPDFEQDPVWIAMDLASKSDLCAQQRLYRREVNAKPHYFMFGSYWLPEKAIEDPGPNHAHYVKWVKEGWLTQTDGATVDFNQITDELIAACLRLNPEETVFDPFNATQMMQAVMAENITAVEFIQTPQNFAVPLDELTSAVADGRFHHDGNPITTWCMSNMVARPAKKGLVSPIKQKPHQKIDGGIAAIMCVSRAAAGANDNWLTSYLEELKGAA